MHPMGTLRKADVILLIGAEGTPQCVARSKASVSVHGVAQGDLTYNPMQQTPFPSLGNMQLLSNKQAL